MKAQIPDAICRLNSDLTVVSACTLEIDAVTLVDFSVLDTTYPAKLARVDVALFSAVQN